MKSLIQKLVEAAGPSGYETAVRELVRAEVASFADEIRVDALGNLIVRKGQGGRKIMLAAHIDEIGVIVTHIEENGYVRFTSIGGVFPEHCIGGRVRFLNGQAGVIYVELIVDRGKMPTLDQMYIDVGATSSKDCPVRVGDVAVFDRTFADLGDKLVAKAMDDRISAAVLIEALRQLKSTPHEVYFVFSVQEEVGTRGATTAAYAIDPDIAISVDVTRSGDTPKGIKMAVALGKGPGIKVRDGGMLSDPRIIEWMTRTAEKARLPYQLEVLERGTTDARAMQVSRAGVPAGCLSIPCRYIHSPSEMVDYRDVQNGVRLLVEMLSHPLEWK